MPTYNNKVVLRNGTVVLDVTPTTAVESDVASGKIFVKADGSIGTGTASGDNVFVVTLSWDDDFLLEWADEPGAWVPDQTWAEIKAAGDAGKEITVTASDDFYGTLPAAGHYYSESEPPNELTYAVISYAEDKMIEYDYSISGTGIESRGYSAAIYPSFESISRTYTPSDQVQTETITYDPNNYYNGIEEVSITVNAMPTGTAGTPFATKSKTGQNTMQVRPAVTNVSGYINGGTIAGDPVTVDAYEVVKGTYTVDSSGTKDVTNYASASVPAGTEGTPTATKGAVSNHAITVTPSVTNTAGYISGGTKTGTGVSVTVAELESGTKSISANGTGISVSGYSAVDVNVSATETVFVVTLSWDSQENMYMPDCTYAQAYAAYQAGKTVAFECDEDDGYAPYCGVYSEDDSCFVYCVLKNYYSSSPSSHWGFQLYSYLWTSEGIELDENQMVYGMDGADATAAEIASGSYAFSTQGMVEGTATRRTSSDLTASGATVTAPAGFYASSASKAVASGTAGTPTATKGSVSNHAVTVTPSVTNTAGYISGGTKTGTGVSVTASELVSGSETKTANGTYDVTNLASLVVNVPVSSGVGTLLATKSLGTISTTSTQATNTNQTVSVTGINSYDLLIVETSVDNITYNRHTATVGMILLTASSTVGTKDGATVCSNKWNSKISSAGVTTTRQSTTAYGIYPYSCSISSGDATISMYMRYNSTQTGTINKTYTVRVYGVKLYDLIGG